MPAEESVRIPAILVTQPLGSFYIGKIAYQALCEITKVDIRRLEGEKGYETYLGIQRPRSEKRVKEIASYVLTHDACFPTSVILAVSGQCAEFEAKTSTLVLTPHTPEAPGESGIPRDEMAIVLDGQHRIEGLKAADAGVDFEINVSIFIDMDVADQAYLFSTINLAQTKVNKSLVYDLFSLAKRRSPQKTCHNIAVTLDTTEGSPFKDRIKRLGVATSGRFSETITQATFVESLLRYVSVDPVKDRDLYLRGRVPRKLEAGELQKVVFGNMFIEEKDFDITDIVWNYYSAVAACWPESWRNTGRGNMLNKTNGFRALMRFLREVYLHLTSPGGVPTQEQFLASLRKVRLKDKGFTTDKYAPGTSGESLLYRELVDSLARAGAAAP